MIDLFRPYVATDSALGLLRQVLTPDPAGRLFLGEGELSRTFEQEVSEVLGLPWPGTAVSSGTAALEIAYTLAGLSGVRGTVISTPMTCLATNVPFVRVDGHPRSRDLRWSDVDPLTGVMDVKSLTDKDLFDADAIVTVDWGGVRPDYALLNKRLRAVGNDDCRVIRDAAHTFSHEPLADIELFSFQAIKFLTTGDGGYLYSSRQGENRQARLWRWFGLDRTSSQDFRCAQDPPVPGFKAQLNDISAAIGLANLPHVQRLRQRQWVNAEKMNRLLAPHPLICPPMANREDHWLYTVLIGDRDGFKAYAADNGVMVSEVHRRNDAMSLFERYRKPLPGLDVFSAHQVALPIGWWLTEEDLYQVASVAASWAQQHPFTLADAEAEYERALIAQREMVGV